MIRHIGFSNTLSPLSPPLPHHFAWLESCVTLWQDLRRSVARLQSDVDMSAWEGDAAPIVILQAWLKAVPGVKIHENLGQGDSQLDLCKAGGSQLVLMTASSGWLLPWITRTYFWPMQTRALECVY